MAVKNGTNGPSNGSSTSVRFERIQQLRAHEYVAEQIRRHIALRLIQPGEALPAERELAVMFGVGRPTIQHALSILEGAGLVEARRGRSGGTFVSRQDQDSLAVDGLIVRVMRHRKELEDLLQYRRLIEPAVARAAAGSRRAADLAAMRKAIRGMTAATNEPEYMRHDTDFHIALARATGNKVLTHVIEDIRLQLNDAMTLLPESDTWHRRISGEHEALLEAIERGDGDVAERVMEEHVAISEQGLHAVLAAIRRRGSWKYAV
ncbi:MAG TPA: FadR/GntR family transcriptional regulator [Candidatus Sulfotelmatobacter sp.]|nr:FadR/GntR family transcriptional regulator [Candidatus Sulfotelmatobacter sp.]